MFNIEQQIQDARKRGLFDDLPNKGKRLDMSDYFSAPPELRMAYSILKSNGFTPEEVQLKNEISHLRKALSEASDPVSRKELAAELRNKMRNYNHLLEQARRRRA